MLKEDFNSLFTDFKSYTFNKYAKLLTDRKYGATAESLNTDFAFLQMELLEVVEEANLNRAPKQTLILPCMITQQQIESMLSNIKNQLI